MSPRGGHEGWQYTSIRPIYGSARAAPHPNLGLVQSRELTLQRFFPSSLRALGRARRDARPAGVKTPAGFLLVIWSRLCGGARRSRELAEDFRQAILSDPESLDEAVEQLLLAIGNLAIGGGNRPCENQRRFGSHGVVAQCGNDALTAKLHAVSGELLGSGVQHRFHVRRSDTTVREEVQRSSEELALDVQHPLLDRHDEEHRFAKGAVLFDDGDGLDDVRRRGRENHRPTLPASLKLVAQGVESSSGKFRHGWPARATTMIAQTGGERLV